MTKLAEVAPQMIPDAHYQVHMDWAYLNSWLNEKGNTIDLDPEFQRGHVWTEAQQVAYVEYKLRGGTGSDLILWNADGWTWRREKGATVPLDTIQLVDGKQRLTAVLKFLDNELKVFGSYRLCDFEDEKIIRRRHGFVFKVNNLQKQTEVLQWYLELNGGGTPHSAAELARVRELLKAEEEMSAFTQKFRKS